MCSEDRGGIYINETGRQAISDTLKGATDAWLNSSVGASPFVDHLIESGHTFDPTINFLLHSGINSYRTRIALEALIEIIRHAKHNDVIVLNRAIPEDGFLYKLYNDSNILIIMLDLTCSPLVIYFHFPFLFSSRLTQLR